MLEIIIHDQVAELRMTDAENDNTLHPEALVEWNRVLDEIEANQSVSALLLTSSSEKTFSTGINLPWVQTQSADSFMEFVAGLDQLLLRLATFPMPTVAALNGNTYAGGALIAAAMDFRVMRADRGRFCFAEVNIKIPFSPVMIETVKLLPNQQSAYELAISGVAWGGQQCAEQGIVDAVVPLDELFDTALAKAQSLAGKDRKTFTTIKRDMRAAIATMARDAGLIEARCNDPIEPPRLG